MRIFMCFMLYQRSFKLLSFLLILFFFLLFSGSDFHYCLTHFSVSFSLLLIPFSVFFISVIVFFISV